MDDPDLKIQAEKNKEASGEDQSLEGLKAQAQTLTASWQRAAADYQNLAKRVQKEKEDWLKFANAILLGRFLDIFEDIQKAQAHLGDEGLEIVLKNFKNIFREQGLVEIEVQPGDAFDPNLEECVELVAGEEGGKITAVVGRGYIMGERVVRPAKVKVSKKNEA